jgi:hypothetical protein
MRASLLLVVLLLVPLALVACTKSTKSPNATKVECEQYRDKMFSFLPDSEREAAKGIGMDKPTKLEVDLCMQRMTSEEVACALKAGAQADALACKPSVDIRPAEAKRTPEECTAYSAHVMKLAEENEKGEAMGPPFTPAMAAMFARECERWLTKARFDCVMKAPSPMGLMMCKP